MSDNDTNKLGEQLLACVRGGIDIVDVRRCHQADATIIAYNQYAALGAAAALKKSDMLREILILWPDLPLPALRSARDAAHFSSSDEVIHGQAPRRENWQLLNDRIIAREQKNPRPPGLDQH